ncbi:MAG: putative Na+/H+ antiporter [Synergistaceae bacterium]|nr:putative Na+/H+ antiporter [Synergistaceae bacterium]
MRFAAKAGEGVLAWRAAILKEKEIRTPFHGNHTVAQTSDSLMQILAAILFALAILHTFSAKFFLRLAHAFPRHAGAWHLLSEVEVVFGFWAMVLIVLTLILRGERQAISYFESCNFTEPLFVLAIMTIAGTRPILEFTGTIVRSLSRLLPIPTGLSMFFLVLSVIPLLGSFITEPAAMTLAAMMLRETLFAGKISEKLKYVTIGVLFVNISIGGTLTPFAAPPILMVAGKWNWDFAYMIGVFGWKSVLAVFVNAASAAFLFRAELAQTGSKSEEKRNAVPYGVVGVHLFFLASVVAFAHHAAIFMGLLCFFLGYAKAYKCHQSPLILREAFLVAFFLAGLVVLGGKQQWWLQVVLMEMGSSAVYYGTALLTAVTDNAALTYLGSLVEGLSEEFKIALVSGAVTGGGLTIIANAPNPAGAAILKDSFPENTIRPLGLLFAAIPPTLVVVLIFRLF